MNYVYIKNKEYYQRVPRIVIRNKQYYHITGGKYERLKGIYQFTGNYTTTPITNEQADKKTSEYARRQLYWDKVKIYAQQSDKNISEVRTDIKIINDVELRNKHFGEKISRQDALVRMGYNESDTWNYMRVHDLGEKIEYKHFKMVAQ